MYRRLDLKVGFACNNNCRFCAAGHKREMGNKDTERIKSELLKGITEGFQEVVLTGGEPTIRLDIIELVSYASSIGYEDIQLQSNGRMFSYMKFCEGIVEAGGNEFALSIHGPTAEIHDFLTRVPGSFEQTVQGIKNLRSLDQHILTNSVVTKSNYLHLPELAHFLVGLGVDQLQMAFVHAVGNADKNFDYIVPRKSLAAPYIKRALQIGLDAGIKVMAEDMPYCFMKGYESYLGELYAPSTQVVDIDHIIPKFEETRVKEGKCKGEVCKRCKYYSVCEGPWREYPERRGWSEFIPVEDKSGHIPSQTPLEDEGTMLQKANEYFTNGDISKSFAYNKKVLDKNPCNQSALQTIAEIADFKLFSGRKNDFRDFMNLCSRALEIEPDNAAAHFLMARILKIGGLYKKAIDWYSRACALDPENWRGWTLLGIAYRNNGDIETGNKIIFNFRVYKQLFSKDWHGIYYHRLKNLLEVIHTPEDLSKIIKTEPKFKVLSFQLEQKLLNRKTGKKIIQLLDKLRAEGVVFRMSRPLPRCLFSVSEYQKLLEMYEMPKNCLECSELALADDKDLELCSGSRIRVKEKITKDQIYAALAKTACGESLTCKRCMHNLRGDCGLLCFTGGESNV